jgi:hypothetical protein
MHQKCSNYTLTNILFSLCKSMWIIDLLVTHLNPHFKAPAHPSILEVLWVKERTPTLSPSVVFTFGFIVGSIKEFKGVLQPHFEGSVRSPFTFPKMGLGSLLGLSKTQSAISGVKTPCIEVFFILLKRSWSVDVQNGFIWAIWTSLAQVMVERKAGSQIGNLTPDH